MYICYGDESGHCGKKWNPAQPAEVLCGVMTDVTKLFKSQREHAAMLADLGLSELKSANVYRGRREWSDVLAGERDELFDKVFGWADDRVAKFFVCPIDSKKFFAAKRAGQAFAAELGFPYEAGALNLILAIERAQRSKKNNKGKTIVVLDEQAQHDQNLLRILASDVSFTDGYTGFKPKPRARSQPPRLGQIVDVPHFSKSHLAILIQVADLAAFVTGRHLALTVYHQPESYLGEASKVIRWMDKISANLHSHTATDPPGKDPLVAFFKSMRPDGWDAKRCRIA